MSMTTYESAAAQIEKMYAMSLIDQEEHDIMMDQLTDNLLWDYKGVRV